MKKKDPPDYPGDDAVTKAFGEAVRRIRLEKGLSIEQAEALLKEAVKNDPHPHLYRALGIVVRQLREKQSMSRTELSSASGLQASRFISRLERGNSPSATLTQIVRLCMALKLSVADLVEEVLKKERELTSE
jgi:transcriptional regulator with XRE-family HTH domain